MAKQKQLGELLLELEEILDQMVDKQDLQWADMLFLVYGHLMVHRPDAQEVYEDGTNPIFYYGHKDHLKR